MSGPLGRRRREQVPSIIRSTFNACHRICHQGRNGAFKGQLKTLSIRAEITITANTRKANDTQPDYRVHSGDVEIGAGWNRRSESSGNTYVSLSLAAPEFGPRRLYANLGRAADGGDDRFAIIWNPAD